MKDYEQEYFRLLSQQIPFPKLQAEWERFLALLWNATAHLTRPITEIPVTDLTDCADWRAYEWQAERMVSLARQIAPDLLIHCKLDYNREKAVFFLGGLPMYYETTLTLSYREREVYYPTLYKIEQLIGEDGIFTAFVNNMIYDLEFKICIGAKKNAEQVKQLVEQTGWEHGTKQGFDQLFMDAVCSRKYMMASVLPHQSYELFCDTLNNLFFFRSEAGLEKAGYNLRSRTETAKIFISYCHKDKEIVYPLVNALQDAGMNVWIDTKDISVGDSILRSITEGLAEHDLGIMFLSKNYLTSRFSKFELDTIMDTLVRTGKPIFPVKVDDVDAEKILFGLSGYKYLDYNTEGDTDEFVKQVRKKITQIQKEKESEG